MSKSEYLQRDFPIQDLEIRADGKEHIISGYAIVFNQRSQDLGGFVEIVKPKALNKTLADERDIKALFNHNSSAILGSTRVKTLILEPNQQGLRFELRPPNTSTGRDSVELLKRGDIDQMSFGFQTIKDTWEQRESETIRYLDEIRLLEISLTPWAAYPQTSVYLARSILNQMGLNIDTLSQAILKAERGELSQNDEQHIERARTRLDDLLHTDKQAKRLDDLLKPITTKLDDLLSPAA